MGIPKFTLHFKRASEQVYGQNTDRKKSRRCLAYSKKNKTVSATTEKPYAWKKKIVDRKSLNGKSRVTYKFIDQVLFYYENSIKNNWKVCQILVY